MHDRKVAFFAQIALFFGLWIVEKPRHVGIAVAKRFRQPRDEHRVDLPFDKFLFDLGHAAAGFDVQIRRQFHIDDFLPGVTQVTVERATP